MAIPPEPEKQEHPSTYVVKDRSNQLELLRLDEQDQLFTAGMGGVLPEQANPNRFQQVLDVGCGPGWWLIEVAKTYPQISQLVGLDVSANMIAYAIERAQTEGISDRVSFRTGDALRLLEFPDRAFDLVNQRFGMSFLRKWDWPRLLHEYYRVCRVNGIIRITEFTFPTSNSPALTSLYDLLTQSMYNAGNLFEQAYNGVTGHIGEILAKYGIAQVQTKSHIITYSSADSATRQHYINDLHRTFINVAPFLKKWTKVSGNYEELYQQMITETSSPDFQATQELVTAWGKKLPMV